MQLFATNAKNDRTGYGRLECGLIQGFEAIGLPCIEVSDQRPANGSVTLIMGHPEWADTPAVADTTRWLYTMSETMRVSRDWVQTINRCYERVFVPCPALVDIYQNSGVIVPVDCVQPGMDFDPPPYATREAQPDTFTWLAYALGDSRKGIDLSMFAFDRVFGGDLRYKMIIKCRDNPLWLTGLNHPQIEMITGAHESWWDLMARCQAFVFPSRGEGYGYPPREAVLSGMPTIATEWLGMWDVGSWGFPLSIKELVPSEIPYDDANEAYAPWAEPEAEDLDAWMLWISKHYDEAKVIAEHGRDYLLQYTWKRTCEQIASYL